MKIPHRKVPLPDYRPLSSPFPWPNTYSGSPNQFAFETYNVMWAIPKGQFVVSSPPNEVTGTPHEPPPEPEYWPPPDVPPPPPTPPPPPQEAPPRRIEEDEDLEAMRARMRTLERKLHNVDGSGKDIKSYESPDSLLPNGGN